ncbi:hypothetical protein [Candidatus Electrothrix sp.]
MSDVAVELRSVSKVFFSKKAGSTHAAKEIDLKIFQQAPDSLSVKWT